MDNLSTTATPTLLDEIAAGEGISLGQVCKIAPPNSNGKRPHLATILRWITKGTKTPDGRVVKMEATRCGGRWVSTAAAFRRFLAAQQPVLGQHTRPEWSAAARERMAQRRAQQARAALAKLGI